VIAESMANGRYFKDISISLQRVLVGFGLAFICSIPVAFLMGWYPTVRNLVEPWIQFMRTIPPIALIPLVILAMGGSTTKYPFFSLPPFGHGGHYYQGVKEVDKT
jgi:NitT/TauT family transport system permease protein